MNLTDCEQVLEVCRAFLDDVLLVVASRLISGSVGSVWMSG
jgi:hypothetical protein